MGASTISKLSLMFIIHPFFVGGMNKHEEMCGMDFDSKAKIEDDRKWFRVNENATPAKGNKTSCQIIPSHNNAVLFLRR